MQDGLILEFGKNKILGYDGLLHCTIEDGAYRRITFIPGGDLVFLAHLSLLIQSIINHFQCKGKVRAVQYDAEGKLIDEVYESRFGKWGWYKKIENEQ